MTDVDAFLEVRLTGRLRVTTNRRGDRAAFIDKEAQTAETFRREQARLEKLRAMVRAFSPGATASQD